MTDETAEKLPDQLDKLKIAAASGVDDYAVAVALADYLEQSHAELVGRLEHVDGNTHRLLQLVGELVSELDAFRPLLAMFKLSGGTRQPDWISAGQALRTAKREARRNGGDQRAGETRGSAARRGTTGRQLPDAEL